MPPIRLKRYVSSSRDRVQLNIPSRRALIRAGRQPSYVVGNTLHRLYRVDDLPLFDIVSVPPARSTNPESRQSDRRVAATSAESTSDFRYTTLHSELNDPESVVLVMIPPTKAMRAWACDVCPEQHDESNPECVDNKYSAAYNSEGRVFEMNGSRVRHSFRCKINIIGSNVGVNRAFVTLKSLQ